MEDPGDRKPSRKALAVARPGATTIILESGGGPFVEGGHSLAKCVVYAKSSAVGLEVEAPCSEGRLEFMGGTGEYAGVMGSCAYETHYLADEGVFTQAHCEWHSAERVLLR